MALSIPVPSVATKPTHSENRDVQVCPTSHVRAVRDSSIPAGSEERERLFEKYRSRLVVNPRLTRQLVSFQANKDAPFYRWFRFKEAFSTQLVETILDQFGPKKKAAARILDPCAGVGTAITVAAKRGWAATGIELLPVGITATGLSY